MSAANGFTACAKELLAFSDTKINKANKVDHCRALFRPFNRCWRRWHITAGFLEIGCIFCSSFNSPIAFSRRIHSNNLTICTIVKGGSRNLRNGGGASPRSLPPPSYLPFLSPSLPPPLRSIGPRKPARGPGERYKLRSGVGAEPWPKTNIVHYKAVRKPLEAIILNILSTMFYSRTIKI